MAVTYEIGHVMTPNIETIDIAARLSDAAKLMVKKEIGSLGVAEKGKLVGIVTERDILKCYASKDAAEDIPVGSVMGSPLITVESGAAIGHAADIMAKNRIRRLLVTKAGRMVGIVTERDIMRATLDVFNKLADALV